MCTATTPWLDGKHVVFGQVVDGFSVVKAMEACGSSSGETAYDVMIADSGLVARARAAASAAARAGAAGAAGAVAGRAVKLAPVKRLAAPGPRRAAAAAGGVGARRFAGF
jgi:peptidyl-prolyl isomerase F (cyclophilin D)